MHARQATSADSPHSRATQITFVGTALRSLPNNTMHVSVTDVCVGIQPTKSSHSATRDVRAPTVRADFTVKVMKPPTESVACVLPPSNNSIHRSLGKHVPHASPAPAERTHPPFDEQ
jgi:hypothetical protein